MKRAEIIAQLDQWMEEVSVTCRSDKRAGKSVTGSADPVTVYKVSIYVYKSICPKYYLTGSIKSNVVSYFLFEILAE